MTDKEPPTIAYWKGKQLDQCDREELIECIKYLSKQVEESEKRHSFTLGLWESFRKAGAR